MEKGTDNKRQKVPGDNAVYPLLDKLVISFEPGKSADMS
jgi:hypothetical protein